MVQNHTLRVGDAVVCGNAYGPIKAMHDTLRPHVTYREAGPSTPINATGLDVAPSAGDRFYVVADVALARQIATSRPAAVAWQRSAAASSATSPWKPCSNASAAKTWQP